MEEVVKKDILSILKKGLNFLKKQDADSLLELSNHTTHNASIVQDQDSISIAVVVYAVAKVIARNLVEPLKDWDKIFDNIIQYFERAKDHLEKGNDRAYRITIRNLIRNIGKVDDKLKLYIEDVLNKARIVKGTKLYEKGISVGRAAAILGISQWELMSYIGKTKISEKYEKWFMPVKERLDYAKEVFGL